jgi:hypothetical protein
MKRFFFALASGLLFASPVTAQEILELKVLQLEAPARPKLHTVERPKIWKPKRDNYSWGRSVDSYLSAERSLFLLDESVRLLEEEMRTMDRYDDTPEAAEARFQERFRYSVEQLGSSVEDALSAGSIGTNASRYSQTVPQQAGSSSKTSIGGAAAAGMARD